MTKKIYAIAKKLKEKLSGIVHIVDFRVFGSRARGDEDRYSDMDVFLEVVALNKNIKEKILNITWETGFKNLMVISPIIFTKEEIENSPLRSSPLVKNITKEGIRI